MGGIGAVIHFTMIVSLTQTAEQLQWSRAVDLVPQYVRQLASHDPAQRAEAIDGLAQITLQRSDGAVPPTVLSDALPVLMRIARQDRTADVRSGAMEVIGLLGQGGSLGRQAQSAVATLSAGLTDDAPKVREMAALMLGGVGRPGRGAIPGLRRALRDPSPRVRQSAAGSLGSLGAQEAREDLRRTLTDSDPYVRRQAEDALEALRLKRSGKSDE